MNYKIIIVTFNTNYFLVLETQFRNKAAREMRKGIFFTLSISKLVYLPLHKFLSNSIKM